MLYRFNPANREMHKQQALARYHAQKEHTYADAVTA
jgi:hypothetical protein